MKLNKIHLGIITAFIMLGFVFSYFLVTPPSYKPDKSPYPIEAAISDLKVIAEKSHSSAEQEELAKVRNFLINRFTKMGIETAVNSYIADNWFGQYEVNNITAQIDGQNNTSFILIMAHYDSVMEDLFMNPTKSTGAIDDGYGIVTLLQIAEYFSKKNITLTNGIKFLLTDSEETGPLEGSKLEIAQNSDFYKDVSLIINIEARGFDGPVAMIQTSKGNRRVIELYRKANHRFTNSMITELFGFMVNFTDLSPFLDAGFSGLNFGTIGHMKYYHSDEDNLDNVNSDTLNHYGEQIVPIVAEFVHNSRYSEIDFFKNSGNSTFFMLLPGLLVSYGNTLNIVLLLISFILLVVLVFIVSKKNILSKKQCLIALAQWFFYTIACVIAGTVAVILIAFLADIPLYPMMMVNYPFDTPTLIAFFTLLFCGSIVMLIRQAKKHGIFLEMFIGGIALNLLIALLCVLILPGCAFLFLLPSFTALLILWIQLKLKLWAMKIVIAALLTTLILLYAPLLYILYYALTIGSLFVLAFILAIGFSLFTPLVCMAVTSNIFLIKRDGM